MLFAKWGNSGVPVRAVRRELEAAVERAAHVGHFGSVPAGEVAKRGERRAVREHVSHVGDVGGVPAGDVEGCEVGAAREHVAHVSNLAGVPVGEVAEGREGRAIVEHAAHSDDVGGIPVGQAVNGCEGGAAVEHPVHVDDVGSVQLSQIACGHALTAEEPTVHKIRLQTVVDNGSCFDFGGIVDDTIAMMILLYLTTSVDCAATVPPAALWLSASYP